MLKQTKFYQAHKKLNAKIVEFAGYEMPVQYTSIIAEHKAVRSAVGVFDVSHMGQVFIKGPNALAFVQKITVNDASKLFPGRVQYSAMCYEDGGIVDDLLVYCLSAEEYLLVVNASNIAKDYEWMVKNNSENVQIDNRSDDYSLLAIQGPYSQKVVEKYFGQVVDLEYYHFFQIEKNGIEFIVSRTGYTGELGYELYFTSDEQTALKVWDDVFAAGAEYGIVPVGLGARDTLRLEMGFCLYGNDIDATTNPLEAGLGWITRLNKGNFIGREALLSVKEKGLRRKLTPLTSEERTIPRHGYDICVDNVVAGHVTSGAISPVLDKPIALAYVDADLLNVGADLNFLIRGKACPAKVVKLPFIER
jgi:aminomethyltransferase